MKKLGDDGGGNEFIVDENSWWDYGYGRERKKWGERE